jgi:hypothetical protein
LDGAKQLWLSFTMAVHPIDERPLPPIQDFLYGSALVVVGVVLFRGADWVVRLAYERAHDK